MVGSAAEKCALISEACASTQSLLNFYSLYYCNVKNPWAMAAILALLIVFVFIFIYEIVDEYVVPAVLCIVKTLHMSDALAGVTLLAFANGAGDVITALVASGTEEAVSYNIGGVVGAGLFVLTVVVFATTELSPTPIFLPRSILCRDLPVYCLGTTYVLLCGARGRITFHDALGIIALYFVIVLAVMGQERTSGGARKQSMMPLGPRSEEEELEGFIVRARTIQSGSLELVSSKSLKRALRSFSLVAQREDEAETPRHSDSTAVEMINALDWPLRVLRRATIPPCNEELYTRRGLAVFPLFGLPFLLWALGLRLAWAFCLPVSLTLSFALHSFAPKRFSGHGGFPLALSLLGIFVGVLWTKIVSELLIDSLGFIGMVGNLSTTYLGLTVIAMGSALPDAITTVALGSSGQAALGLTGGYAGQIFGLLIGFGSSMAKRAFLTGKPVAFDLFCAQNLQLILVLGTSLLVILATIGWGLTHSFRLSKSFTRCLFLVYLLFFGVCTAMSVREAYLTF